MNGSCIYFIYLQQATSPFERWGDADCSAIWTPLSSVIPQTRILYHKSSSFLPYRNKNKLHTHSWCGLFWRKGLLWILASWSFFSIVITVQKNIHYTTYESYTLRKLFSHSKKTNRKLKLLLKYDFKSTVKSQPLCSCICAFLYLGSYNSAKNPIFF